MLKSTLKYVSKSKRLIKEVICLYINKKIGTTLSRLLILAQKNHDNKCYFLKHLLMIYKIKIGKTLHIKIIKKYIAFTFYIVEIYTCNY